MNAAITTALACALLTPSIVHARDCSGAAPVLLIESMELKPDGQRVDTVLRLKGMASLGLEKMRKDYRLESAQLQMDKHVPRALRMNVERVVSGPGGSTCLAFEPWRVIHGMEGLLENVSDLNGAAVSVCIAADGLVTSTLKVTSKGLYFPHLEVRMENLSESEEITLIEADAKHCPN